MKKGHKGQTSPNCLASPQETTTHTQSYLGPVTTKRCWYGRVGRDVLPKPSSSVLVAIPAAETDANSTGPLVGAHVEEIMTMQKKSGLICEE